MEQAHTYPHTDLDRFRKDAPTRRELAWELLKQTRNPEYVALRYDYPIETMRQALAKLPPDTQPRHTHSAPARACHSTIKRASELLPEIARDEKPPTRSREPGEDDDLGE